MRQPDDHDTEEHARYETEAKQEATYAVFRHMGYEFDRWEGETMIVKRMDRSCDTSRILNVKRIDTRGNTSDDEWPAWHDAKGYPHPPEK